MALLAAVLFAAIVLVLAALAWLWIEEWRVTKPYRDLERKAREEMRRKHW